VRLVFLIFLFLCLICFASSRGYTQEAKPDDQFFSGTITEVTATQITVARTVLGKNSESRTFAITPDTRVEGSPKPRDRVTVRFVSGEDGEKAVHIIVRSHRR